MSCASHRSRSPVLIMILFGLLASPAIWRHANGQTSSQAPTGSAILDLIYRQKYNEALNLLEQVLENDPGNSESLTYMATANLYLTRNFFQAEKEFKKAFAAGGGATFFVTHSHEKITTGDVVDYCRGWFHLRRKGIEYAPIEGNHGFKLEYHEVKEFKRNKLTKRAFHIKAGERNQNFRGRSNTELESLLIVALYQSFKPN